METRPARPFERAATLSEDQHPSLPEASRFNPSRLFEVAGIVSPHRAVAVAADHSGYMSSYRYEDRDTYSLNTKSINRFVSVPCFRRIRPYGHIYLSI